MEFEEYDTPETRTENGVAAMPGGGEAAWFKDSEGNLVGVVPDVVLRVLPRSNLIGWERRRLVGAICPLVVPGFEFVSEHPPCLDAAKLRRLVETCVQQI